MKKNHNKLVIIIIAIACIAYIGNLAIDNPYTHRFVNFYLNEKILKALPIEAEYQSMKIELVPPSVNLYGVKIRDTSVPDAPVDIISTNQTSLSLNLWSLFLAKPHIADLEIQDMTAIMPPSTALVEALNKLSLATKPNQKRGGSTIWPPNISLPFSSIALRNASLKIVLRATDFSANQDPGEITTIATTGADLDIEFNGWRDIKLSTNIQQFHISNRGSSLIESAHLKVKGHLKGNKLRTSLFKITSTRLSSEGEFGLDFVTSKPNDHLELIAFTSKLNTNADLSVLGSFIDLAGTTGPFTTQTSISFNLPIGGKGEPKLLVEGRGSTHGGTIGSFHLYDSEADFSIDSNKMTFKELRIKSGQNVYGKGSGEIEFDQALSYKFNVQPEALPFDMLLGVFNVPLDAVNFDMDSKNLKVVGQGDPFSMRVEADTSLTNFSTPRMSYDHQRFPKSPQCNLTLQLKIDDSQISYEGTKGQCRKVDGGERDAFPLVISGFTSFNDERGMNLTFASRELFNPSPLDYFAQLDIHGQGNMQARIHGPYSAISIDASVLANDFYVNRIGMKSLESQITISNGVCSWKNLVIHAENGGELRSAKGSISFNDELFTSMSVMIKDIDHGIVSSLINEVAPESNGFEFVIGNIEGDLKGPLLKPLAYEGQLKVSLDSLRSRDQEYASRIHGQLVMTTKSLKTTALEIELGNLLSKVDAEITRSGIESSTALGSLGIHESDRVSLEVSFMESPKVQDQLRRLPVIGPLALRGQVQGTLSGSSKLAGTLTHLSGLSKLRLDHVAILGVEAPAISSTIISDGLKFDMILEQGGSSLKGRLNVDAGRADLPYKWYITAKNLDLRPVVGGAFSKNPRNFAYISATSQMEGSLSNWWQSQGSLEIKSIRGKMYPTIPGSKRPLEWNSSKATIINMNPNSWTTEKNQPFTIESDFGRLAFGLADSAPPKRIGLTIDGRISLESLKTLFTGLEVATGDVQLAGGVFGSVDDPTFDISFQDAKITSESAPSWQPVSIGVAEFRPALKDIQFMAHLRKNALMIESFTATKGLGRITSSGLIGLAGQNSPPSDFSIRLDNASFLYPFPIIKSFDSQINGNIQFTGVDFPLLASGQLDIVRARSTREIDLREAILDSLRSSNSKTGPDTLQPTVNFDIAITGRESISFNTRAIQATLSSKLELRGSDVSPEVLGLVEINKGKFFWKRDFIIQRGLVNFDDPIRPDPSLDINSISEVSGYRVLIGITGRASQPVIDFSVDPPTRPDGTSISRLDIITLLSRGSLPDAQAGARSSAESTATAEALNLFAGQVEDTVQKVFDLSGQNIIRQVYIDTYADANGTPIARFNLPMNITQDLDIVLKVDQSNVNLSSEYALQDTISVTGGIESSSDKAGSEARRQRSPADTGVDLKFKFAFP
jgi:hypothetical protein